MSVTTDGSLNILVLSDLHGYEAHREEPRPSAFAVSHDSPGTARLCDGIIEALSAADIPIDLVACPGDIADSAEPGGLIGSWIWLNKIADQLEAPLVATVGNHDLQSRPGGTAIDPRETLINLFPDFPAPKHDLQAEYFAYNFAIADVDNVSVLTLNSCSTHGLIHDNQPEFNHGRISETTARRVKRALETRPLDLQRVAITHHHPVQLPGFDRGEPSLMKDAIFLLEALEESGDWLIIHGHKHRPWLHYANGGGGSAVVFSASSLAANPSDDFGELVKNQFHVVTINSLAMSHRLGLGVSGVIRSWTRIPMGPKAWVPATEGEPPLMATAGFGWRVSPHSFARRLVSWLETQIGTLDDLDFESWEPRIRFILPQDMLSVISIVNRISRYRVSLDSHGMPTSIQISPED